MFVNLTNDGWFGTLTGPRQHMHQARIRAVEEGLPVVRAANNGISGVISPTGRFVAFLDLNKKGSLDADLPQAVEQPLYARLGDATYAIMLLIISCIFIAIRQKSR